MRFLGDRRWAVAALAASAALLSACGGSSGAASGPVPSACTAPDRPLVIATGSATGVYAALGSALAQQLASTTPLKATAVQTGSTLRNVQQLNSGEYDVAFAQADSVADAVRGRGVFAEPQKIQALARIYSDAVHVVVTKESGIASMADFRGKRISTGAASSGTQLVAERLLTAAGLDPKKDVTAQSLDLPGSVAAIKEGRLDGFVWSGGVPTTGIADLFAAHGAKLALVDTTPLLSGLHEQNDVYTTGTIPAGAYGLPADVPVVEMPNMLVVREDFSPEAACAITKTLFERKAELVQAVPAAAGMDPARAADTGSIELNSGSRTALNQLGAG
jgi:hypothetical protein